MVIFLAEYDSSHESLMAANDIADERQTSSLVIGHVIQDKIEPPTDDLAHKDQCLSKRYNTYISNTCSSLSLFSSSLDGLL